MRHVDVSILITGVATAAILFLAGCGRGSWEPAEGPLTTTWTDDVTPHNAHREYPRPQMERDRWQSLNGLWSYSVLPVDAEKPSEFEGEILVPFPVESALSGVKKRIEPNQALWYEREIRVPASWRDSRIMLHFGAVDWDATVYVNGQQVMRHLGGYDPFSADITDVLAPDEKQIVTIRVTDPTDSSTQPRGKQVARPEGIWYTPTTGIWQSVWMEPVPVSSISQVHFETSYDPNMPGEWDLLVESTVAGAQSGDDLEIRFWTHGSNTEVHRIPCGGRSPAIRLKESPRLWTPETPVLYDAEIRLMRGTSVVDEVRTYFAVRTIELGEDANGHRTILLNGQPYFMLGLLDQGFWPDGLYTAPTDDAMAFDIRAMKDLGFNTLRKHVKVEPQRWYWWCDRLGMLVWQDMPSGDRYIGGKDPDHVRTSESAAQFDAELRALIRNFRVHPCIVVWVPFNEGWGQSDTRRNAAIVKEADPTRLVDPASGWVVPPEDVGDLHDIHVYPGPAAPAAEERRAGVLGEFGGLGLPVEGHTWQEKGAWGYVSYKSKEELTDAYVGVIERLPMLRAMHGLSAAIYTQVSDVEIEVNGLLTYDRRVMKVDRTRVREANKRALGSVPAIRTVIPTSAMRDDLVWRYRVNEPAGTDWILPSYDDTSWPEGRGGFGTDGTPGAVVRTTWNTSLLWMRRSAIIPKIRLENPKLLVHHDEDCEIFINGVLTAALKGYTTGYEVIELSSEGSRIVKAGGPIVIAVHCRQTGGGQYMDVGIIDVAR